MNQKNKVVVCIVLGLLVFSLATIIWAYQNGKITIFGSEKATQSVFNYNTADQWKKGEFQNTTYSSHPNYLTLKFVNDTTWKPPFQEGAAKCIPGDAKCLFGTGGFINLSQNSGYANMTTTVVFSGDGKVYKSNDQGKQLISTCFTAEEMALLLTEIEYSGFWDLGEPKPLYCDDCGWSSTSIFLLDKQKTIGRGTYLNLPEKVIKLSSDLWYWPDYHANSTAADAIPACTGITSNALSFENLTPGCMISDCKSNPSLNCTAEYEPVCGTDGKTYGNKCEAGRACAKIACLDKCPCPGRDSCFPKLGWGGYVDYGYYLSDKIGSETNTSFQKLEIDPNDIYIPTGTKITFQFAGSNDSYKSWSNEQELSTARCGDAITDTSRCVDSKYTLNLSTLEQLKNSKYLKVRINYKNVSSTAGTVTTSSKASLKYSPMIAAFNVLSQGSGSDSTPPSKANNLKSSDVTANSVKISWDAAIDNESGIAKYHIYRTKSTGSSSKNVFIDKAYANPVPVPPNSEVGTTKETSYTITGLDPNTRYQFWVIAENGTGLMGPWSDVVNVTTLSQSNPNPNPSISPPPSAPTQNAWSSLGKLVSTGSSIWINLAIAAIFTTILSVIILRKRSDY